MDEQVKWWFPGFEAGLAALPEEQRKPQRACGKYCVCRGTLEFYREVFWDADGDLDVFFTALDTVEGVETEILASGRRMS